MQGLNKNVAWVCMFLCLTTLVNPAEAGMFEKNGVSKAQEYIDMDKFSEADEYLQGWIHDNPKDFNAYWVHANLLMKPGYRRYSRAYAQFGYALKLKSGKQKEVEEKFKNAFREEISRNDVSQARDLGKMVISLNPSQKQQVYDAFYAKGKTSSGQVAVSNFEAALEFAGSQIEREKIGKNFLKIAIDNPQFGYLTNKATDILGKNFVDQVLPSKTIQTLFSNTYTEADLDADGKVVILDFTKTHVVPGDVLNISTSTSSSKGIVTVHYNDGVQNVISENGWSKSTFVKGDQLDRGCITITFAKGHDVSVRTNVVTTRERKTDYTRLGGI